MRPAAKPFVAVDIGSTKVACLFLMPASSGAWDVAGCGLARYQLGASGWPAESLTISQALEQALEEARVPASVDRAVAAFSHPDLSHDRVSAQIRLADEPMSVRNRDVERLHRQAVSQALGIDREVFLLEALGYTGNGFTGVRDARGLVATRLAGEFQLVAVPLAVRRVVRQAFEATGLEVTQLVYSLSAALTACSEDIAAASRVLVMDIGGWCTDLAIVEHGRLVRSATAAWGGMSLVDAIAKRCGAPRERALMLSLEGLAGSTPEVRAVVEEQLAELRTALDAFLREQAQPERVVVSGGSSLIGGMLEWIEAATGLPASLGRHAKAKEQGDLSSQMSFSTVYGLVQLIAPAPVVASPKPVQALNRLVERTKILLNEYF